MITKSKLAIELSSLKVFDNPKIKAEQYPTDSETAAETLWFAKMRGDIDGRIIADLGCGTGILGIGAILLGADKVFFVDNDKDALNVCKENIQKLGIEKNSELIFLDVNDFNKTVDVVIQNPPFGTKTKHADREFLEKAFIISDVVYSFHKLETQDFIGRFANQRGFEVTNLLQFEMPLKASYKFHKSKIKRIEIGCWRFEKVQQEKAL